MNYQEIVAKLIEKKLTIGSSESLTGGLFASTISSIPGVSQTYKGSIVSYSSLIKRDVLMIPQEVIDQYGVVSYQVGFLMAKNVASILDVDVAVSFTGNAGPSAMEGKPVGLVYIGICFQGETESHEFHFQGSRDEIRKQCVDAAFELIKTKIF